MAGGPLSHFVFIFGVLCQITKGINITLDPSPFEIKFVGDFDTADVHHHNSTIICTIRPHWDEEALLVNSKFSDHLDGNLCTHLNIMHFKMNFKTRQLEIKFRQSFETLVNWDEFLLKLHSLKQRYPWLHMMIQVDNDEGIQEIINNNYAAAVFYKSVFEKLSSSKLDGVFIHVDALDISSLEITQFICGLSKVLWKSGFTLGVVFTAVVGAIFPDSYHSLNSCVDLYSLTTIVKPNKHTELQAPFRSKFDGICYGIEPYIDRFIQAGFPVNKLSVQITMSSSYYILKENNLTIPDCCGIHVPASFYVHMAQSDVCHVYHRDGPWFRYQIESLEVFMTNGRSWFSFDDWISLKTKIEYISQLGAGVLVHNTTDDETYYKCGFTNVSFPLLRNINYWVSKNGSKVVRRENRIKILVPPLPRTSTECGLLTKLKRAGVNPSEYPIYICLAKEESNYTTNFTLLRQPKFDSNGCSTTKYGMFGLFSPICGSTTSSSMCGPRLCPISCSEATDANLTDDIQCIQTLKWQNSIVLPSMPFCLEKYGHEYYKEYDSSFCDFGETLEVDGTEEGGTSETTVATTFVMLGSLFLLTALAYFGRRYIRTFLGTKGHGAEIKDTAEGNTEDIPCESFSVSTNEVLGRGEFGIVYKALVFNRIAAAKTAKPFAKKEYITALLSEIQIMASLGSHVNVIEFIGASTEGEDRGVIYIFTEFCALGSLQSHLRAHKQNYVGDKETKSGEISKRDLFSWCHQIANGMAFLSVKDIVHGDLSSKNILLTAEAQAKISDFGLSRKLNSYILYAKKKQEPLPWRWMSIEALRDLHFSIKSDVWAFGVTMWEIFTMGDLPYPKINYCPAFLNLLIDKNLRLEKPEELDDVVFQSIMQQTWMEDLELRPDFSALKNLLQNAMNPSGTEEYTEILA